MAPHSDSQPAPRSLPGSPSPPDPFYADMYAFDWSGLYLFSALFSVAAVAFCLFLGIFCGHPGAGLIAGGGAFTIGFGSNQRIAGSRIWPMLGGTFAIAISTVIGMIVGHHGYALLASAAIWSFVYGLLTIRNAGIAWVGQQSAITLFVSSAFPASPRDAFIRAFVILCGGVLQTLITSISLHILPELKADLLLIPKAAVSRAGIMLQRRFILARLHRIPAALPGIGKQAGFIYAVRLTVTVVIGAELYRRLGIQSGYWIPMTALLVQKPAFFETLTRALLRIGGTLAGAFLTTVLLAHMQPAPLMLATLATLFAFCAFATNNVNYGLFSLCITSYIVFLLSLNAIPGPVIAHRRALCTIAGGVIALVIHLDALRRQRFQLAAAKTLAPPVA